MSLVTCRMVKRYFVAIDGYARGFATERRAYEYYAKREISRGEYGNRLRNYAELFPLAKCPTYENTTCADYGREFCFCQFKAWVYFRASQLMMDSEMTLSGKGLRGRSFE